MGSAHGSLRRRRRTPMLLFFLSSHGGETDNNAQKKEKKKEKRTTRTIGQRVEVATGQAMCLHNTDPSCSCVHTRVNGSFASRGPGWTHGESRAQIKRSTTQHRVCPLVYLSGFLRPSSGIQAERKGGGETESVVPARRQFSREMPWHGRKQSPSGSDETSPFVLSLSTGLLRSE